MTRLGRLIWRYPFVLDGAMLDATDWDGYDSYWRLRADIAEWLKENRIPYRFTREAGWQEHRHGTAYTNWSMLRFRRAKDLVMFKLMWA